LVTGCRLRFTREGFEPSELHQLRMAHFLYDTIFALQNLPVEDYELQDILGIIPGIKKSFISINIKISV
jgi:hypothetical protein